MEWRDIYVYVYVFVIATDTNALNVALGTQRTRRNNIELPKEIEL